MEWITNYVQMDNAIKERSVLKEQKEIRVLSEEEENKLSELDENIEQFERILDNFE